MNKSKSNSDFHITIGTAISNDSPKPIEKSINLEHDLRLLKCAILYADQVKLCSLKASTYTNLLSPFDDTDKLEIIRNFLVQSGKNPHLVHEVITAYKKSKKSRRALEKGSLFYEIDQRLNELEENFCQLSVDIGGNELLVALNSGFVELQSLNTNDTNLGVREYVEATIEAVTSRTTYPLFDDITGNLVSKAADESIVQLLGTSTKRAKQVGVSANLFNRLPQFDMASMDEVLDIRKELEIPLVRFRGAVIEYSNLIENTPWTHDFPQEVEELLLREIEPSILDIEENYRSNKSLLNLIPDTLKNKGFPASSFLGFALSPLSRFPETFIALSVAAGLSIGAYEALKERRKNLEDIERHQLFFYYRAGKMLAD